MTSLQTYFHIISSNIISFSRKLLLYKRLAGDLEYLPEKNWVFIENVGLPNFPPKVVHNINYGNLAARHHGGIFGFSACLRMGLRISCQVQSWLT